MKLYSLTAVIIFRGIAVGDMATPRIAAATEQYFLLKVWWHAPLFEGQDFRL
ncbi:MAG: hypothetical protein KDE48_14015 [Anaerolineales bacterium]|nr:hypothetical protein [Anaerolineales bacterium]